MSQIVSGQSLAHNGDDHGNAGVPAHVAARAELSDSAVRGGLGLLPFILWAVGALGIVAAIVGGATGGEDGPGHALAAYHVGFLYSLSLALGCLGLTMILHQFNAGWSAAIRRQAENVASLIPVVLLLFLPVVILEVFVYHGKLFHWMDPHAALDPVIAKKAPYLNVARWLAFAALYFVIWTVLATKLRGYSTRQDISGDKWLTARARKMSSYGLLIFALSTAFASFDWLMSMDPHWFSTMFGVYFFAGGMLSCIALVILVLGLLRMRGKLEGIVTAEHFHDLGKLLLAFTIFWAYVTFCQYFLIWYSNIPEETAFYHLRASGGYEKLGLILCLGHFAIPFLLLLFREVKRNYKLLMAVALWQLVMHAIDLLYMARPIAHAHFGDRLWIDILGLLGPLCIFLGFVAWRVGTAPLIPLKDPRLHEALSHKNYV